MTPFGDMFGGFIQANTLNTILNRNPILPVGGLVNDGILIFLGLTVTTTSIWLRPHFQ
jgi:hypothetical protein